MEQQLISLDQTKRADWVCMEAHESDGTPVCGVCGLLQGVGELLVTGKYHGKKALACMQCAFPDYKPTEVL